MATRTIARRVAIATAIAALATLPALSLAASPVAADDPTPAPTEMVLDPPQYLIWWDHHATMDGDVVDDMYKLYTVPPDASGNFTVPDGSGGVFHHVGRLIGGPYTTATQLCPVMRQLGIKSLDMWPPGDYSQIVTCDRFGAAPVASGASARPGAGESGAAGSNGSGGSKPPGNSDDAQILAEALIGVLLFGGGLAGLALLLGLGSGTSSTVPEPPTWDPGVPAGSPAVQSYQASPPDPCAPLLAEYLAASEESRAIQAMLGPARAAAAMLEQRITWIANIKFPGSVGVDLAFLAGTVYSGGLAELATTRGWGLLGRKFLAAQTIKQLAVEGVVKELVKSFG